jgi:parallel beta-helix repeat protein
MPVKSAVLLCLLALFAWAKPVHAAKSFDHCQYYVETIPTVITTPGVWCMRQDLRVVGYANVAINIQASNTTLDCKDFSLDGTAIPPDQAQWGIASDRQHGVTVRNCNVRGFLYGIFFANTESSGNSIVNNRVQKSLNGGILVVGDGSLVRNNIVLGTGNDMGGGAVGIDVFGGVDVIDNLVSGVRAGGGNRAIGIGANEAVNNNIAGNRVRALSATAGELAVGISAISATGIVMRDNDISGGGLSNTAGFWCRFATGRVKDNVVKGMESPFMECDLGQDNDIGY